VQKARDEIYLEKVHIPVEEHLLDFVCGHNDSNLYYFEQQTGAFNIRIEQGEQEGKYYLVAIGGKNNLEDLKAMLQNHLTYFDSYQ